MSTRRANRARVSHVVLMTTFISLLLFLTHDNSVYAAESTLSLSIDSSTVTVNMAPTRAHGTFSKSSTSVLSASTDNATGYTLSISAPINSGTDYDKLINSSDNNAKLYSISSPLTEEQFEALNGTAYNNMWGYLPSKYCADGTSATCATNTAFLPAPTIAGDVLDQTMTANSTVNTYTIGMGARIDSTTKTGKYSNGFIVKLVANAIPYTITYNDASIGDMPVDVDATSMSETVLISSNVPTKNDYTFIGWCTEIPTTVDGTDICSGTTYQPGATYIINQTGIGNNLNLYAMWTNCPASKVCYDKNSNNGDVLGTMGQMSVTSSILFAPNYNRVGYGFASWNTKSDGSGTNYGPNEIVRLSASSYTDKGLTLFARWIPSAGAIQNWTGCPSLPQGDVTALTDVRDNNTYAVAKLADGKCWMIENLRLSNISAILDSSNTNSPIATYNQLPPTDTNWCGSGDATCIDQNLIRTDNTTLYLSNNPFSRSGNVYSYGNYYNWYSATAGNGTYAKTSGNTDGDICPAGWTLPSSEPDSGDYYDLKNSIGDNNYPELRYPNNFIYDSGHVYANDIYSRGDQRSYYWSKTARATTLVCGAYFSGSFTPCSTNYGGSKYYGQSVRCIVKQ